MKRKKKAVERMVKKIKRARRDMQRSMERDAYKALVKLTGFSPYSTS